MSIQPMIITDPDESREYTLEFNRRTVARTEAAGLNIDKLEDAPMTMIPLLFWGAFLMHHPHMTKDQTDRILFDGLGGLAPDELTCLGNLHAAPFNTLISADEKSNPRRMAVKM